MKGPLLEVSDLAWYPQGQRVLEGVTFSVKSGEFLSVIGPNGAGKSSLIRHINAILPSRGCVRLAGQSVELYSRRALARQVAYVPQSKGLAPPFTVLEFLVMARYPYLPPFTPPGRHEEDLAMTALDQVGLASFAGRLLGTLSGGERQVAFIAAAMVQGAGMILLDEPTTYLDPAHSRQIFHLLTRLKGEEGRTILIVTHDVNAALHVSDRVVALKDGRMVFNGGAADLVGEGRLAQIYGVPFHPYVRAQQPESPPVYLPEWGD